MFPNTPFLDALKILDPQEWKQYRESYTNSGTIMINEYIVDLINRSFNKTKAIIYFHMQVDGESIFKTHSGAYY